MTTAEKTLNRFHPPAWIRTVSTGDWIIPLKLWNESCGRAADELSAKVKVLAVKPTAACQTGVMIKVKNRSGTPVWLDAGWFVGIAKLATR